MGEPLDFFQKIRRPCPYQSIANIGNICRAAHPTAVMLAQAALSSSEGRHTKMQGRCVSASHQIDENFIDPASPGVTRGGQAPEWRTTLGIGRLGSMRGRSSPAISPAAWKFSKATE